MSTTPKAQYESPALLAATPKKKLARKWKILIGLAVVVALLMVWGSARAKKAKIPRVQASKVEKQDVVSKVTANGKVQAEKKVDLSALVMGQLLNLAVREGDRVKKGDFLLQIDQHQAAAGEAGSAAALQASLADRES